MAVTSNAKTTWLSFLRRAGLVLVLLVSSARLDSAAFAQANDLAVSFSPSAGTFVGSETVTLSVRARATIHYTLDGSLPTAASPVYRAPLTLDESTRLRAVAIPSATPEGGVAQTDGRRQGRVATEIYLKVNADALAFDSHLPVLLIHTFESGALNAYDTEHVSAALVVIDPSGGARGLVGRATLDARIGIHVRGQSSRGFPKKQYAVELRADDDDSDTGQPLLGLPSHADWVLSDPVVYDRSLIRNAFTYAVSNRMGRYAPRTRFAEVFIVEDAGDVGAQDFAGFFTLIEKIDRDADRVNVSRLPASAVDLPAITGGFIVSIDKGAADFAGAGRWLQFVYPSGDDMARPERKPQLDYIRGFIDSFGQAVSAADFRHPVTGQHYSEFIDVDSWIDHHILNTLAKNPDGMRFSSYFHKDRGGPLAAGPVWDFDRSFGTPYDLRATEPEEWLAAWPRGGQGFATGWWGALFNDPVFRSRYQARFRQLLDGELSVDNLERIVDGLASEVGAAADRNFRLWVQTPPIENSYAAEIALLKDFLRRRVTWIKGRLETDF